MKYREKSVKVEAITFQELVELAKTCAGYTVNDKSWSFCYKGHLITRKTDTCFLITTRTRAKDFINESTMKFNDGDMLITNEHGTVYPCNKEMFDATYEEVKE